VKSTLQRWLANTGLDGGVLGHAGRRSRVLEPILTMVAVNAFAADQPARSTQHRTEDEPETL
jgi:hypothetical protein